MSAVDKPLLVLPPRYTDDSIALSGAAARRGWDVERLANWRAPEWLAARDVAVYGEPLFVAAVAEPLNLFALEPRPEWLARLPSEFRRRDVRLTTLAGARSQPSPAFIKPALDKAFSAKVYASGAELPPADLWPEETPTLVSDVVEWAVEWRCFVLDRGVLTASPYWREGQLARTDDGDWPAAEGERREAIAFARRVLAADDRAALPPAVVLDVGRFRDGRWAVVEANSAWGAGIYGCDPDRVLEVVRRGFVRRDAVSSDDLQWVIER